MEQSTRDIDGSRKPNVKSNFYSILKAREENVRILLPMKLYLTVLSEYFISFLSITSISLNFYFHLQITHWNSPYFHAFYPTANSYPAIVGEIISCGFGCVGFSWISSPACTELEVIVMNWLGKLLGLPKQFLSSSEGHGGGVIQVNDYSLKPTTPC